MVGNLRLAFLVSALVLLTILPISNVSVLLILFVAVDLGAAALLLRSAEPAPSPVVALGGDMASLPLMRRTVPALRSRRPAAVIEAQVLWRHAAATHRQRSEFSWSKLR